MVHIKKAIQVIDQSAHRILDARPEATVRIRLLRDVLRWPAQDEAPLDAKQDVIKSRWVQELAQEQQSNGSWGGDFFKLVPVLFLLMVFRQKHQRQTLTI